MKLKKKSVLILCHDTIGSKMAGPGIRYQNIAEQVRRVANVSLAVFSDEHKKTVNNIISVSSQNNEYQEVFDSYDIIFAQWLSIDMLKYAKTTGKIVIIDLYAPVPIEYLAGIGFSNKRIKAEQDIEYSGVLETYKQYLTYADFFVCSNERQRDFWLGFMTSLNILKPSNFLTHQKMDHVVLCPMGISSAPPFSKTLQLRKRAGLSKEDFVLLWTGGIWDWFDSLTVVKAVAQLNNPKIKLVFLGTKHPNTKVPEMSESKLVRDFANEHKLTGNNVFFLDGWVNYDDRASYLLDADAAIYADKDSIETRFSHRTRVLDHIWSGLPTICSKGDYLSSIIDEKGMGVVTNTRTVTDFAEAIDLLYKDQNIVSKIKTNIKRQQGSFTWEVLSEQLLDIIENCEPEKRPGQDIQEKSKRDINLNRKVMRRVKNSVKVLLGRIDV